MARKNVQFLQSISLLRTKIQNLFPRRDYTQNTKRIYLAWYSLFQLLTTNIAIGIDISTKVHYHKLIYLRTVSADKDLNKPELVFFE